MSERGMKGPNWERAHIAFGTGTPRDSAPTYPCAGCAYPLNGDPKVDRYCAVCLNHGVHLRESDPPERKTTTESMSEPLAAEFYAADLDGDTLEMGEPTVYQTAAYNAFLAVVLSRAGMLLNRDQAEQLRDYLNEKLASTGSGDRG